MKISEATLLKKVGLSEKFPRRASHARKSQLGVGILTPNAILTTLSLKLYLGHHRNQDAMSKQIIINKKEAQFQCGFQQGILETESKHKPKHKIWSNEIAQRLNIRGIRINMRSISRW